MGGAVAPIFLMFKKEILKGATSKHVEHMNFRNESGISKSEFKKKSRELANAAFFWKE